MAGYLGKHGPTHSSLMDFCEEYREKYHIDLCWPYPISDGNHMVEFFVPVKEGILSLSYDRVEREDYEVPTLEDACLCDATSLTLSTRCLPYEGRGRPAPAQAAGSYSPHIPFLENHRNRRGLGSPALQKAAGGAYRKSLPV